MTVLTASGLMQLPAFLSDVVRLVSFGITAGVFRQLHDAAACIHSLKFGENIASEAALNADPTMVAIGDRANCRPRTSLLVWVILRRSESIRILQAARSASP